MFLTCIVLVLLVLLQLPKKEAGAGMAFGGGATDALFGAGSGNVLTKITKYAVGIFFFLAVVMAWTSSHMQGPSGAQSLTEALSKSTGTPAFTTNGGSAAAPAAGGSLPQMQLISNLPAPSTASPAISAPATNK
jgi:preprotein translocase subunit SecG